MKTSQRRILLAVILSAFWTIAATGCDTLRGFGKDMEHAGHRIQKAAN